MCAKVIKIHKKLEKHTKTLKDFLCSERKALLPTVFLMLNSAQLMAESISKTVRGMVLYTL